MPHDLVLTPHLDDQQAAQLTRMAKHLDRQLDHPTGMPQPVAQSGLLEQLGTFLWEATRLEVDIVRAALDAAQEAEHSLRFVVQGEPGQYLPWELLDHPHPELGFVARSRLDCEREEELLYTAMDRPLARGEIVIPHVYIEADALVRGLTSRPVP